MVGEPSIVYGYLLALWENSSDQDKLILAAAASSVHEAGLSVSSSVISGHLRLDPEESQDLLFNSLEDLNRRRLLLRVPETLDFLGVQNNGEHPGQQQAGVDSYLFAFDLLRLWLKENHPFSDTLNSTRQQRALPPPLNL